MPPMKFRPLVGPGWILFGLHLLLMGGLPQSRAQEVARAAADWPQWRGPQRTGQVAGPTWPERLDGDHLRLLWQVKLGPGYPGPIVAGDRVFVAETENAETEVVRALDRRTGKELWQARWPGAMKVPFFARSNGDWIRATPAYDGETLYVAGMRDVLVALDAATGAVRWRVDFVERFNASLPDFGFASSPLVVGEHIYVQAGASFVKLDKRTGETIWRTLEDGGGMWGSAFSSPVLMPVAGREQLLVQTRQHLCGVDPETGRVLFQQEVPAFRGMNIVTPTVWNDQLFTSAYGGRTFLYRLTAEGDGFRVDTVWDNKTQGYMSSPVIIDGHAYLHLRNRRFTSIDLATGKENWITKPFGEYWSLVAQGDRILALEETGELLLIRANPAEFTLLDRRKVSEDSTWGHLAISGDQIFIRELNAVSVYEWVAPSSDEADGGAGG